MPLTVIDLLACRFAPGQTGEQRHNAYKQLAAQVCRNKEAQMMTEKTISTEWINERNRSLARAGEGIVAARKSLDQLDSILRGVERQLPELRSRTRRRAHRTPD